jgi:hypothetical protein
MRYLIIIAVLLFSLENNAVLQAQSVMLIPFSKRGESKRLISDNDPCYRIIETKIFEAFSEKANYRIYNSRAAADKIENLDDIINTISQVDLIALLLQNADPDIYLVVDFELSKSNRNTGEYKIVINLTAHRTADGLNQAAKLLDSGWRYSTDCVGLTTQAFFNKNLSGEAYQIDLFVDELLKQIQVPAQPVNIEFYLSPGAHYNYFSPTANSQPIAQAINSWISDHLVDQTANNSISDSYLNFPSVVLDLNGQEKTPAGVAFALNTFLGSLTPKGADTNFSFTFSLSGQSIIFHLNE